MLLTALDLYHDIGTEKDPIVSTGSNVINDFLGGGIRKGITEIAGGAGSGKTQLCLQCALNVQLSYEDGGLNGSVVYICTEDWPRIRFEQLSKVYKQKYPHFQDEFGDHIYILKAQTLEEQMNVLFKQLPKLIEFIPRRVKLIIFDSIAALTRTEFDTNEMVARAHLFFLIAGRLKQISGVYNCPILITNQVTDVFVSAENTRDSIRSRGRLVRPALGLAWANCVNTRIILAREEKRMLIKPQIDNHSINTNNNSHKNDRIIPITVKRCMCIVFSSYLPPSIPGIDESITMTNRYCIYEINNKGIQGIKFEICSDPKFAHEYHHIIAENDENDKQVEKIIISKQTKS